MNRSTRTPYNLRNTLSDPITQQPISARTHFRLRLGPISQTYNAISLAKTIIASTGIPRDPISQIPIPQHELERLDSVVRAAGHRLPSVRALLTRQQHPRPTSVQCIVDLMDMRIGETLHTIFSNLDLYSEQNNADDAYYHLYFIIIMVGVPDIINYLNEIHKFDPEHARHLSNTVQERLRGPPNHPTFDPTGKLVDAAIHALRAHSSRSIITPGPARA